MTDSDRLERFAELVVRVGANVRPGSGVLLGSDIAHLEIARAVVEHAYAAGASWVEIEWSDGPIRRSRLTHASIETLTKSRPWAIERTKAWAAGRGVSIQLLGDPDPHLLDDVDPAKAAAVPVEEVQARREARLVQQLRWTVVPAPNPGWAQEVRSRWSNGTRGSSRPASSSTTCCWTRTRPATSRGGKASHSPWPTA